MKRSIHAESLPLPGFQIAPMIDVVFVIMLFFMVMAASARREGEVDLLLPSGALFTTTSPLPDAEITLGVHEDGTVTLNEEALDPAASTGLPALTRALRRLAGSAAATRSRVLASIQAEPQAGYQRVMDVLDALSTAGIKHVTFELGTDSAP